MPMFSKPARTWTSLNTEASLPLGTKFAIQNQGSGLEVLESATAPAETEQGYRIYSENDKLAGDTGKAVWVRSALSDKARFFYQEYKA